MSSLRLEDYDMSKERGYLCRFNAEEIELSGVMKQVRDVALRMPQILPTGRVREIVCNSLPETDLSDFLSSCSDAQARLCLLYTSDAADE